METYLDAVEEDDFLTAAHVLDLRRLAEAEQAQRGPDLAAKLAVVIDRSIVISWQQLQERPDALVQNGSNRDPLAGTARRSLLLGLLDLEERAVAVRLNRIQPAGEDPVWVFSDQTVDNIDALYQTYRPSWLEESLPDTLRTKLFWGLRGWELVAIPLIALAATIIGLAVYRVFDRLGERTSLNFTRRLIHSLRWPILLIVTTIFVDVMTRSLLVVSGIVSTVLEPVIKLGYVSAVMMLAVSVIDAILDQISRGDPETMTAPEEAGRRALATTVSAMRRIAVFVAVVAGMGIVLASANVFTTLGFSLIASAGALTIVLGFAAREVLGNILASLQISLNRSARIGDQVIYEGRYCTVEAIHFTFVQLKIWDGQPLRRPGVEIRLGRFRELEPEDGRNDPRGNPDPGARGGYRRDARGVCRPRQVRRRHRAEGRGAGLCHRSRHHGHARPVPGAGTGSDQGVGYRMRNARGDAGHRPQAAFEGAAFPAGHLAAGRLVTLAYRPDCQSVIHSCGASSWMTFSVSPSRMT